MAFKVAILACLVAAACAQTQFAYYPSQSPYVAQPAPLAYRAARPYAAYPVEEEEYGPAHYQFQYEINAPETGDAKSQQETRDGNNVQGVYTIAQPDGLLRIVEYGDNGAGFFANVKYQASGINIPQAPQYRYAPVPSPYPALAAK